jgi:hypothetical protein
MKEILYFIAVLIVGILIGMSWSAKGIEMKCNQFILDTYVNVSYEDCQSRCDLIKPNKFNIPLFNFSIENNSVSERPSNHINITLN